MPGAEPATPASSPSPEPHRDHQHVPEPKTEGKVLEGHNVQAVSHIQNPSVEERDLGIGPIPADGSFVAGVPATKDGTPPEGDAAEYLAAQEQQAEDPAESEPEPKTPRGAAKSENSLTPAEGEDHKHAHASPPGLEHHTPEGSDATAVSTGSNSGSTPGGAWAPGTYVLLNARSGTAVDMSGMDNKTLIGYPMHGGPNQQWEFIPSGYGYVIRCVRRSAAGDPLYLTTEDGLRDDAAIVASPYPVTWDVEQTEDGIKISWPNTDFVFDLADWGSATPGTKIQLMHFKPDQPGQLWHYTRCAPAEHEKELEVRSARAVSPPATTETVSVTEERDHITTTRTTTTTTMTTITEVTRMPRWMLAHARSKSPNRRSIGYRVA
ncbi:hypothetical protein C8Q78DRAFT_980638 [Trametes maxima]|nr:hypothetical protein C8Q78DRAFT_980638 [Trametes maxima]